MSQIESLQRLIPCILLGLIACTPASDQSPAFFTVDSAGVRISVSDGPAWTSDSRWGVNPSPLIDIGQTEGEDPYLFTGIVGAVGTAQGGVAVVDRASAEIRVFDDRGIHLSSSAGKGGGPGELQNPLRVIRYPGDSILVVDFAGPAASVYSSNGSYGYRIRLPQYNGMPTFVTGVLANGDMVVTSPIVESFNTTPGTWEWNQHVLVWNRQSDSLVHWQTALLREVWVVDRGANTPGLITTPANHAEVAILTADSLALIADNRANQFVLYRANRDVAAIIRNLAPPTTIGNDDLDRWRQYLTGEWSSADGNGNARLLDAANDLRPTRPTVHWGRAFNTETRPTILHDDSGNIWVHRYRYIPDDAAEWDVYDAERRYLGVVTMPSGFDLLDVYENKLIGAWADSLGVPHVRVYALEK